MPKSKTYEEFVEKFKPKRTTDDCYTPPAVYEVVLGWVIKEYGVDPDKVVRPFYPGGDYENFDYSGDKVVVDNPPFSILSKICEWYLDRGIKFFLFAPSLTVLSGKNVCMRMNHIVCDADIVYENGAKVITAFVTSLGDDETVLQTAPELGRAINNAVKRIREETTKAKPKYDYPYSVVTAAMLQRYSRYGVEFRVQRSDCVRISTLDLQKEAGKGIFGGGLLLSERAAAERAAAQVWELSEREREIVKRLGHGNV